MTLLPCGQKYAIYDLFGKKTVLNIKDGLFMNKEEVNDW